MTPSKVRRVGLAVLATGAALLGVMSGPAQAVPLGPGKFADCFWTVGAANATAMNVAFPDADASYWAAYYILPAGAKLQLEGRYPHSRFAAIQSYNLMGSPVDALADYQINPDPGSVNPFRPRVPRTATRRSYTLELLDTSLGEWPSMNQRSDMPVRNALHTLPMVGDSPVRLLMYRVFVPDRGRDLRGSVQLPQPRLTLADGTVLTGKAACAALLPAQMPTLDPAALQLPKDQYDAMRYQPGVAAWFPAKNPPAWRIQYNRPYLMALYNGPDFHSDDSNPTRLGQSSFFPNLFVQYARVVTNRKLGKVVAFRGRLATTPRTLAGERYLQSAQVRYESFCTQESMLTTRVTDCAFDEQIPLRAGRRFVVVASRRADRPRNATARCGVTWLDWSSRGDGGRDHDFGSLQMRTMLPSSSFHHSIQDTRAPGDEHRVMGSYLPAGRYYPDRRAFEKLGCPVR